MRLSKASYYADFFVYPPVIVGFAAVMAIRPTTTTWTTWIGTFLVGMFLWTFLEYIFHRFILHHVPFFCGMHDLHHENPRDFIGTPTWASAGAIAVLVMFPLWRYAGYDIASGVTAGLCLGYLLYVGTHHVVHHWRIDQDSYLYGAKRRHALHHYGREPCYFGVSTAFWDHVFRTVPSKRERRA